MSLRDELVSIAGTDLFGVADAVAYGEKAPEGHRPADVMKGARSIVLIGTRMLDAPLDGLPATAKEYTANFHIANAELNRALFEMVGYLERRGNKAFPIPYKEMPGWNLENRPALLLKSLRHFMEAPVLRKVVGSTLTDDLSYRHMAIEAGMGELGVNNLLLVPGHGARVRLVALLTDARLKPGAPVEAGLCRPESCGCACVRACPVGALSEDGRPTRSSASSTTSSWGCRDRAACAAGSASRGVPPTRQNRGQTPFLNICLEPTAGPAPPLSSSRRTARRV